MKRVMFLTALMVAALVMVAAVAAAPNFGGTWVFDKSKSDLGQQGAAVDGIEWVVTQDDKKLALEGTIKAGGQDRPVEKMAYNLDGTESTAELGGRMPGKATLKAKWMGEILELKSVRKVSVQGNEVTFTITEHWELADGGKSLKVHRTTESPRGSQEAKLTFAKK